MEKKFRSDVKSCIGEKFGRLTVIGLERKQYHTEDRPRTMYVCKCDCGKTAVVRSVSVRKGLTRSCGCLAIEKATGRNNAGALRKYQASFNHLYHMYSTACIKSNKRNLTFSLTKQQFRKLTKQNCTYCGKSPSNVNKGEYYGYYVYSGLDRIDNEKGYTLDNVVPCCKVCNWMRRLLPQEEFLTKVKQICHYQAQKEEPQL